MKIKKICFISLPGYPLFNKNAKGVFGGAELQTYLLSKELSKFNDLSISVLVCDEGQNDVEVYDNVSVVKTFKRRRKRKFLIDLIIEMKLFFGALQKIKPDIIFKRGSGASLLLCVIYKFINKKIKIIYNVANISDVNGDRFRGLKGKLFLTAMNLVDVIILQTNDQYQLLSDKQKTKVPTNGIIRNIFHPTNKEHKKEKEYILWVARCVDNKRPELFLKLVKDFPDEHFVMISPKADEKLWYKIKNQTKSLSNLTFIEKVPFQSIEEYYERAKIFINTSNNEGYPNTFLQSINAEVPILSLSCNPDNLLEEYKVGIDCKNDYENLRINLDKLLSNDFFYNSFLINNSRYLKEVHGIKMNILKLKNILDKI